ncbi:MAG: hypothetical protein OHK0022_60990 [Roseiflexaceae bacterium]
MKHLLKFAICIQNTDYQASLEVRKIYQVLPDEMAAKHSYLRVIDESGEDYLYPSDYFLMIDLPQSVAAIEQARGCPVPDTPEQRDWVTQFWRRYAPAGR